MAGMTLDLNEVFRISNERCKRWHPGGIEEWSALEWAGAMCGEAGEAANAAKKLKRVESHLQNINAPGRSLIDVEAAQTAVSEEACDTILYALLLMSRVGVQDPAAVLARVFNRKSVEYEFPERLKLCCEGKDSRPPGGKPDILLPKYECPLCGCWHSGQLIDAAQN